MPGLRRLYFLTRLLLALPCLAAGIGVARAEPALWVAHGPHATVYLFGTVHVLPHGLEWQSPTLTNVLQHSNALWLEVADPTDMVAGITAVGTLGFDFSHPLSSLLSKDDNARLADEAKALHLPLDGKMLEIMRPWLAALVLQMAPIAKPDTDDKGGGAVFGPGADLTLRDQAIGFHIAVHGFETIQEQLGIFADMPQPAQIAMLHQAIIEASPVAGAKSDEKTVLLRMVTAWVHGNVASLARERHKENNVDSAALDEALFTKRNIRFAAHIAELLQGDGQILVAVGAGHLTGSDSVQVQAAKLGVHFERVSGASDTVSP